VRSFSMDKTYLPVFNPLLREQIIHEFNNLCRHEYYDYLMMNRMIAELDRIFFERYKNSNSDLDYYTRNFQFRVGDRFTSAMALVAQGFLVDALSLVRTVMEELWLILNFHIKPSIFNEWEHNEDSYPIHPHLLLRNLKQENIHHIEHLKVYQNIYHELCERTHPSKMSFVHNLKCNPIMDQDDEGGLKLIQEDVRWIVLTLYAYLHQSTKFLLKTTNNNEEVEDLKAILLDLKETDIHEDFFDLMDIKSV